MKKYLKNTMLLAIAGLAFIAPSAKAAYTDGDLFLGFYSTSSTKDYLIYIGNYSNYTTSNGVYTGAQITLNSAAGISIGTASTINAGLTTAFGAGWYNDPSVQFGVIGVQGFDGNNTLAKVIFASDPGATSTVASWAPSDVGTQFAQGVDIRGMAATFGNTSTPAKVQSNVTSNTPNNTYYDNSAAGTVTPGYSFEVFQGGIDTSAHSTYLDELVGTDATAAIKPAGSAIVLGKFTVGNDGTITYATPIPEPSTYAIMGLGSLMLVVMARRRSFRAA